MRLLGGAALLCAALACAVLAGACRRGHAPPAAAADPPAVVVRDETEGLLLTWIDDKGDFHVETKVADVPLMGRDTVRVVDPNKEEASGNDVFVVDLRQVRNDGTYPVRSMPRAAFETLALARRQEAGPTLAGEQVQPGAAPDVPAASARKPAGRVAVIIYGAAWCGACHDAARYLRRKGIPYVEKDIEADPSAAREMQEKLAKSGLNGGSIPVIDVRGKVMVGFNPTEIDALLGEAL